MKPHHFTVELPCYEVEEGVSLAIRVKGDFYPAIPGNLYGAPENSYPAEPEEFECLVITGINGTLLPEHISEMLAEDDAFLAAVEEALEQMAGQDE